MGLLSGFIHARTYYYLCVSLTYLPREEEDGVTVGVAGTEARDVARDAGSRAETGGAADSGGQLPAHTQSCKVGPKLSSANQQASPTAP